MSSNKLASKSSSFVDLSSSTSPKSLLSSFGGYTSALTASLRVSMQNLILLWRIAYGSLEEYTSMRGRDSIHWLSWSILASITPSRIALATIYSVSSTLSRLNFYWTSFKAILEYETLIFFKPNLMTVCCSLCTRDSTLSDSNRPEYFVSSYLNFSISPCFT